MVIYVPALSEIMRTEPLAAGELAFCVLLPGVVFVGVEIEKWLMRRGVLYRQRSASEAAPAA